jgi:hypothetical protein
MRCAPAVVLRACITVQEGIGQLNQLPGTVDLAALIRERDGKILYYAFPAKTLRTRLSTARADADLATALHLSEFPEAPAGPLSPVAPVGRVPRWVIDTDDFATTDGLIVETVNAQLFSPITGYLPTPANAGANGRVWTALVIDPASSVVPDGAENGLRVTAKFGWPAVPDTIKLATLIQASRLFARRHAPFGVAGNPEVGQLRLLERLDVDLAVSVRPYARIWGAV